MCISSNAGTARLETRRPLLTPASPALADALADYYRRSRTFPAPFEPARGESFFAPDGQRALLEEESGLVRLNENRSEGPAPIVDGEPPQVVRTAQKST